MDWEIYSRVYSSKIRQKVLKALDKPKTPTQLAKELKINQPHVSRALAELLEDKLVELLTPSLAVGRFYKRTRKAEDILKKL